MSVPNRKDICPIQFFCSVFELFGKCSVLILEMCSRYFDLVNIKHQAVNKHHTVDSAIFCLSIGASGLLQSNIKGYTEPTFSNGLSRRRDSKYLTLSLHLHIVSCLTSLISFSSSPPPSPSHPQVTGHPWMCAPW